MVAPRILTALSVICVLPGLPALWAQNSEAAVDPLVSVTLTGADQDEADVVSGRVVLTAQDGGILLEERNGTLHNLTPGMFRNVQSSDETFRPLDADELAAELVAQRGVGFGIQQTDHFVICTNASPAFTTYCADLLELVYQKYFEFFDGSSVTVTPPSRPLPVVLFRREELLKDHATKQHPETTFESVPGYYSVRFNQIYIADVSSGTARHRRELLRLLKKRLRHTETIVHETVHLLGYNSGLHVRMADNPLWFTEGLAAWFEPASGRGNLLWTGPGRPNPVYVNHLKRRLRGRPELASFQALLQDDELFQNQDTVADAYAVSWAVTYSTIRRTRATFDAVAAKIQERKPLVEVKGPEEVTTFTNLWDADVEQLKQRAVKSAARLPVQRR